MSISMYRAYISMVIVFRTYGCTSFLSSFNNESVMFVNREKKSYTPVWKSNFVYYNLCDEQSSKSTSMVAVQYKNNCCLWEDACRENSTKLTAHPQHVL